MDVYWNRTRRLWSLREDGLVVAHLDRLALGRVTFHASEAGRQRMLNTGERTVHAYARGYPIDGMLRPAAAVPLHYSPHAGPGFVEGDRIVTRAVIVWFEPKGEAWAWGPA